LAQAIGQRLGEPYQFSGRNIILGVSIGIVDVDGRDDWPGLLRDASTAMHRAKLGGIAGICWFEPSKDGSLQERLLLEQELRSAIGTDQLYMMYQPILHLGTGRIAGFEALMRWQSPTRGQIAPDVFIPLAEASGLLLPIERMVRNSPMAAAVTWPQDLSVSINCPAFEFRDPTLPRRMRERLRQTGFSAHRCFIEITESALLEEDEVVLAVMNEIKQMGVRLAIDDFGSGHASLGYLHRFPFDRIKIDKSLVQAMDRSAGAAAIVEATMALGQRLGLELVAEGVETRGQLESLRRLGCTHAQGYFIGRPMDECDIPDFLVQFSGASGAAA
jgi:EAL domain-containing protein (putative c-di-GMP-specific phosphodiesterase class I)